MQKELPFVSIVIPARNAEKIIIKCLESLKNLDYPKDKYEIIISDSNSTDRTAQVAKGLGAKVILNSGGLVVTGRNIGFEHSMGEIVAFSDSDCVMDKDWIKNSIKYFEDPKIGGVGGPNLTPSDETPFGRAVGFVFNQAIFAAGSIHARYLTEPKEVASIPGCNIIFRRQALTNVLPLDAKIVEAEDYVMNQKIRDNGWKLLYTPDTIVWHYRRPSPKRFFYQMYRYAIGRLLIGKRNKKNINLTHIAAGLSLPLFLLLSASLIFIKPLWFSYLIFTIVLFEAVFFFAALIKLRSLKSATYVPVVIILLTAGWSLGFLRELVYPVKIKL